MMFNAGDAFVFLVDTDTYAGSFERPLTAFCTGQIGECGVGEEYAEVFKKECPEWVAPFDKVITSLPDDHGCRRPTSIWSTPGYWNDGMGNHWKDAEWGQPHVVAKYRASVKRYVEEARGSYSRADSTDPDTALPKWYKAYQSVAMFFSEHPSPEMLDFLIRRTRAYKPLSEFDGSFTLLGFRLIRQEKIEKELWEAPA